jgi:hypothetical protein
MSPLRERMIEDMTLAGLALGTQGAYTWAVRRLAVHYRRSPDQLSEEGPSRFSTSWPPYGGPIATRAGCSPPGAGMGRSTNACCRIPSPPPQTGRAFAAG